MPSLKILGNFPYYSTFPEDKWNFKGYHIVMFLLTIKFLKYGIYFEYMHYTLHDLFTNSSLNISIVAYRRKDRCITVRSRGHEY